MSHMRIPKEWTIQRSTPFFTKQTVPAALLTHHNTAQGVFGQLCVMEGTVWFCQRRGNGSRASGGDHCGAVCDQSATILASYRDERRCAVQYQLLVGS